MGVPDYIKYLYEKEEVSINEISAIVGIDWRTAAKYAKKDDWNPPSKRLPQANNGSLHTSIFFNCRTMYFLLAKHKRLR